MEDVQEKLFSFEEKWIKNEITKDTYERWYSTYNHTILNLKGAIERLGENQSRAFAILEKNLDLLADTKFVYTQAGTIQKRELVRMVFDNNLYYQDGIYRTPTMMEMFSHNSLLIKENGCLVYEKKGMIFQSSLPAESGGFEPADL
ncbi:MAG: hypothetical protein KJ712_10175 [Bacteroidetes bacterium]|nr:hypothetical protein [Bacteroidota bacterium]